MNNPVDTGRKLNVFMYFMYFNLLPVSTGKRFNKICEFHFPINSRGSRPEVFLKKGVLKIFSKFTGEQPCRSAISIKLRTLLKSHFGMGVLL